jgi:hypothetical protein
LEEIVAAPVLKTENAAVGIALTARDPPSEENWHQLRRQAAVGIVLSQTKVTELLLSSHQHMTINFNNICN